MIRLEVGVDDVISITRSDSTRALSTLHINNFDCIETAYNSIDICVNSQRVYTIYVKNNVQPKVFVDNLLKRENREDKINKILE